MYQNRTNGLKPIQKLTVQEFERKIHLKHIMKMNDLKKEIKPDSIYIKRLNSRLNHKKFEKKQLDSILNTPFRTLDMSPLKFGIKSLKFQSAPNSTSRTTPLRAKTKQLIKPFDRNLNRPQNPLHQTAFYPIRHNFIKEKMQHHPHVNKCDLTYDFDQSLSSTCSKLDNEQKREIFFNLKCKYNFFDKKENISKNKPNFISIIPTIEKKIVPKSTNFSNYQTISPQKKKKENFKLFELYTYNKKNWDTKTQIADKVLKSLKKIDENRSQSISRFIE